MRSTAKEQMERADVVFTGRVVGQEVNTFKTNLFGGLHLLQWTFKIETEQKGAVSEQVTVESASSSAACGINFQIGKRYQVFANHNRSGLRATLCSGTKVLTESKSDKSQLTSPCSGMNGNDTSDAAP